MSNEKPEKIYYCKAKQVLFLSAGGDEPTSFATTTIIWHIHSRSGEAELKEDKASIGDPVVKSTIKPELKHASEISGLLVRSSNTGTVKFFAEFGRVNMFESSAGRGVEVKEITQLGKK